MKILITGAKGQLGSELCRQLEAGKSGIGPLPQVLFPATVIPVDIEEADLTSRAQAAELVESQRPDVVIHCAAYTAVDKAEEEHDAAYAANAIAPRNLAIACEEVGAKLIHVSTDYVFSGVASSPISEDVLPAPNTVYGSTKLAGEEFVRQFCSRWFIVRTAWLYGAGNNNFVKTIMKLAAEKEEVKVVDDQLGNPTNAEDLAHHLLKLAATEEYGVYHATCNGVCSWYDFACEIVKHSGGKAKLVPCTTEEFPRPAPRPAYSALDHMMLRLTVGDEMRTWQDSLAAYFKNMEDAAR